MLKTIMVNYIKFFFRMMEDHFLVSSFLIYKMMTAELGVFVRCFLRPTCSYLRVVHNTNLIACMLSIHSFIQRTHQEKILYAGIMLSSEGWKKKNICFAVCVFVSLYSFSIMHLHVLYLYIFGSRTSKTENSQHQNKFKFICFELWISF